MKCTQPMQLLVAAAGVQAQGAFKFKNVRIGGAGGYIPSVVFHPTEKGVAFARTDIGGIYRFKAEDDSWTPVTDSIATNTTWNRWGVDALALDAQDPKKVLAAVGMYTNSWDPNNGSIIRSSDAGETWEATTLPFKVGGNMPGRGMGERLAIDPKNSQIVYFGARSGNGLWKSTDGGITFNKVPSFENTGTYAPDPKDVNGYNNDKHGLAFVTFDSTSELKEGATSRIFVGVADNATASVYVSTDAGVSWTVVPDQPKKWFPHKCKLQPQEKALYLTYSDGTGPYDGSMGAVFRYDIEKKVWADISPKAGKDLYFGFGGLGVDMMKPGTLVVASLNSWFPDGQLFRSTDSGKTWSPLWEWAGYPARTHYYQMKAEKAPWIDAAFLSQDTKRLGFMIEGLEINPMDSDHWLYGTGLTLYGGRDLTKWDTTRNITISTVADGIEEVAVQSLASPPGGSELLVAVFDVNGFTYKTGKDLDTSPKTPWMSPLWSSSVSVDYAGNKVENVVRVGNKVGHQVAISSDGGITWANHTGSSAECNSGTVAYSADAEVVLWSSTTDGILRSENKGKFEPVPSLPKGAIIASDKRINTEFYAVNSTQFYHSTDCGKTFVKAGEFSKAKTVRHIVVHPTKAGELWATTDVGIFRSTNHGLAFELVPGLTQGYHIAFGKGEGESWIVWAFGEGAAGAKLYASADNGVSWVDVQGTQGFGAVDSCRLAGSGNIPGQVYVGTNGRGVFYAQGKLGAAAPGTTAESY